MYALLFMLAGNATIAGAVQGLAKVYYTDGTCNIQVD